MKKELPILFSTEMVQAILDGRKIMTRRIVKWPTTPDWHDYDYDPNIVVRPNGGDWWPHFQHINGGQDKTGALNCLYGWPGDILWVREEHYRYGQWVEKEGVFTKTGRQKWQFIPHFDEIKYSDSPPAEFRKGMHHKDPHHVGWYKRLARFMPKAAARIWLEVTDIRVERLCDITEADAKAEGVTQLPAGNYQYYLGAEGEGCPNAGHSFASLWRKINGHDGWEANSWVWVVSFKKAKK
jgi:hypothetical protein